MARRTSPGAAAGRKAPRQRDYHAEYERRIAKGMAGGKTRQQARGHVVREHVRRVERERAKRGGLTAKEERRIRDFAARQARRSGKDAGKTFQDMRDFARAKGFDVFKARVLDPVKSRSAAHRVRQRRMVAGKKITIGPSLGLRDRRGRMLAPAGGGGGGGRDYELEEIFGPPGGGGGPGVFDDEGDYDFGEGGEYDDIPEYWLFYH